MRFKSLWLVGALLIAMLIASNWGGQAQGPTKRTWEYKLVTMQYGSVPPFISEQELNKLGAEGWELVQARHTDFQQGGIRQHRADYYFKRVR